MRRVRCARLCLRAMVIALAVPMVIAVAVPAAAQQIILDRPVRAGGLLFFPTVENQNAYYYAPTRARLATGAGGKPQFSFLRYVETVEDATKEVSEGSGGGIVHAVVQLGVTDAELADATRELRRARSGAEVAGPVIFRSGSFGLVTSFTAENGELTTRVVGLGTAPVLDGGKAAISMQLTKLGAKILHQSFQTATPDISFMFEMQMAGYHEPVRATITADLDRVYQHESFQLGVATTYVQAEITQAMDDLYEKKVIRVEQVGEDAKLEAMKDTAYSKLLELIFQPNSQSAAQLAAATPGRKSALDRASELLEKRRDETRKENQERRQTRDQRQAAALRAQLAMMNPQAANTPSKTGGTGAPNAPKAGTGTGKAADPETAALAAERERALQMHATWFDPTGAAGADDPSLKELPLPEFAAVVLYEMKKSRQRGEYKVDLNKWTADTLPIRFDENIGDLRRYLSDRSVFRDVNLDDPLYVQREVTASLVGIQDSDFEKFLSYASLQFRKTHQGGDVTQRDVRVDRKAFNELGNNFEVVYGFKGDTDRRKWLEYEYRVLWGFEAGETVEDWRPASFNAIRLQPPFRRRSVQLEAFDAEALKTAGVRSVAVQVFSNVGGKERTQQVTLDTLKGELSRTIDFAQPIDSLDYEYEIKWRLKGNQTLSSGRQKTSQDVLYLDELPEA